MKYDLSTWNGETDSSQFCKECDAHCCKLGGVTATHNEVRAILENGYDNHFVKLSDNVYHTQWTENGVCPYLRENVCSIYEVRPMGCRVFPVFQTYKNGIFIVRCPLTHHLSEETIQNRKKILSHRPARITEQVGSYLETHFDTLKMRMSRYVIDRELC